MLIWRKPHDSPECVLNTATAYAHGMINAIAPPLWISASLGAKCIPDSVSENVIRIDFGKVKQPIGNRPLCRLAQAGRFVILSGIVFMPGFLHPFHHARHIET